MEKHIEFILRGAQFKHLVEMQVGEIRKKYDLKRMEIEVLYFLSKCGSANTSADIYRHLSANKGQISQNVDHLCKRNYLIAATDVNDRRYVHYTLTEGAQEIVQEVTAIWRNMNEQIFQGVTEQEWEVFRNVAIKIQENMDQMIGKKSKI